MTNGFRDEFKETFREQFYPKYAENEALARLHWLECRGERQDSA